MVDYAKVNLWGKLVGVVYWDTVRQIANFEYTSPFIQSELNVSPLRCLLRQTVYILFPN